MTFMVEQEELGDEEEAEEEVEEEEERKLLLPEDNDSLDCVAAYPKMRYDDILREIGQIGPYQRAIFFLLCMPLVIVSLVVMSAVFTLTVPDHRCAVPGLPNDTYAIQSEYHRALINESVDEDSHCLVYADFDPSASLHTVHGNNTSDEGRETIKCHRWVYDKTQFSSSIITEFDLVCDKTYIRASSNMGLFAGSFVGCVVFGVLADVLGRKKSLQISMALNGVTSVILFFIPSLVSVIVVRIIQGTSLQMFAIATSTAMELVGPAWRTTMGMGAEFAWLTGEVLVLPLAYFTRDWRLMYLVMGILAMAALLVTSFTPESPRWLLEQGRLDEAEEIIRKIAVSNKKTVPPNAISKDTKDDGPQIGVSEMFKHRSMVLRTLIIFYNWFCVNFMYYGLSLNLDNLPGDLYLNYFIGCVAELAAYVIAFLLLDRLGRKHLHTASIFIGGMACICVIFPVLFLSSEYTWIVTTLAMVGKMASSCCYATLYIMTLELFPTVVRNSGLAFCSVFENTSAMTAPYIADLGKLVGGNLSQALPMLVFGSCALVAGALSTQLPETLGRNLPETVEDAIYYNRKIGNKTGDKENEKETFEMR